VGRKPQFNQSICENDSVDCVLNEHSCGLHQKRLWSPLFRSFRNSRDSIHRHCPEIYPKTCRKM